ncbi:MAG: HAD-IA family hydrolase [Burkholderiaceae bacterium]
MPARFDLLVFDWDGTVVDSTAFITRSIQLAAADLGLPVPDDRQASHVIGLGLREALARAVPELPPERLEEFSLRYRHHYFAREPDIVLFGGMRELLVERVESGCRLAVATGKSRIGLARALEATGLTSMFEATRCADQTHSKPHPAMLLEISVETGVDPSRMLMIGDTTHDLQMAINAGTAGVGVTYGAHPRASLAATAPLALVDSVPDLAAWLREQG